MIDVASLLNIAKLFPHLPFTYRKHTADTQSGAAELVAVEAVMFAITSHVMGTLSAVACGE